MLATTLKTLSTAELGPVSARTMPSRDNRHPSVRIRIDGVFDDHPVHLRFQ